MIRKTEMSTDSQKATKTSEQSKVDFDEYQSKNLMEVDLPNITDDKSNNLESIDNSIEPDTEVMGLNENSSKHFKENEVVIDHKVESKKTSPGATNLDVQDHETNSKEDISISESPITKGKF